MCTGAKIIIKKKNNAAKTGSGTVTSQSMINLESDWDFQHKKRACLHEFSLYP